MRHCALSALLALLATPLALPAQTVQGPAIPRDETPPSPVVWDVAPVGRYQTWGSAEYLLWWTRSSPVPVPLVTTSPNPDIIGVTGAIGTPGTTVLLGGHPLSTDERHGARFTFGGWLDGTGTAGVEASFFFLAGDRTSESVGTPGTPGSANLTVPFFDVSGKRTVTGLPGETTGPAGGLPFAGPFNVLSGSFSERLRTSLLGASLNGVYRLGNGGSTTLDALAGFRWLQLHEDLQFATANTSLPGGPFAGLAYGSLDDFAARNNFYGGQLGLRTALTRDRWVLSATGSVALGDVHEAVTVNGVTVTNVVTGLAAPLQTIPAGAFAQPSNIGHFSRDRFAVVPEVTATVGYQATQWARVTVGYSFLYLSTVAQPGNQIDRNINFTRTGLADAVRGAGVGFPASGPAAPNLSLRDSSYWAQGINFGLTLEW